MKNAKKVYTKRVPKRMRLLTHEISPFVSLIVGIGIFYSIIRIVQIKNRKIQQIEEILNRNGYPPYRLKQIVKNIYFSSADSYEQMTDLPAGLRLLLTKEGPEILSLQPVTQEPSVDSERVLFKTRVNHPVESVYMSYNGHRTLCVSTQSGCPLGCKFCATGKMGFNKNLSVDEICDQVLFFIKQNKRPNNLVLMGMGEPLMNPDIFDTISVLNDKDYFNYGQRKISISTVGLIPQLKKLTEIYPQVNIAFSMHSPNDIEREQLMPVNKAYKINEVFDVLKSHAYRNKRKIFISYIMINGVNDSDDHARQIAQLIKSAGDYSYLFVVNLIKFHCVDNTEYKATTMEKIKHFSNVLMRHGVQNTIRKDFAEEIKGACGQLASDVSLSGESR